MSCVETDDDMSCVSHKTCPVSQRKNMPRVSTQDMSCVSTQGKVERPFVRQSLVNVVLLHSLGLVNEKIMGEQLRTYQVNPVLAPIRTPCLGGQFDKQICQLVLDTKHN